MIAIGRSAGFSLDEIALMFAPNGRPRIDRQMLAAKAEELDRTIRRLPNMRDGIRHAAACRTPSHVECPTFRRILRAAASGAFRPQRKKSLAAGSSYHHRHRYSGAHSMQLDSRVIPVRDRSMVRVPGEADGDQRARQMLPEVQPDADVGRTHRF